MSTATLHRTRGEQYGAESVGSRGARPGADIPAEHRLSQTSEFEIPAALRGPRSTEVRVGSRTSVRPRRDVRRPRDGRPLGLSVGDRRPAGTRCASEVVDNRVFARRRAVLAVLVGVGLAVLVWVVGTIGADYAASVAPAPTGTEVVHVRQGDSLSSIADRVAPDVPRQSVIEEIVARNELGSSGLRVGQALIAPAYH